MEQGTFSHSSSPSPLFLLVIPAQAGIHKAAGKPEKLDSRWHGNDGVWEKT
jgi:hypothetical protein